MDTPLLVIYIVCFVITFYIGLYRERESSKYTTAGDIGAWFLIAFAWPLALVGVIVGYPASYIMEKVCEWANKE